MSAFAPPSLLRSSQIALVALCAVVATGCAKPIDTTPLMPAPTATPTASPTPTPAPTPSPAPIVASPASLAFSATNQIQTLAVSESSYSGTFTVSGCSGIATTSGPASGVLTVTSVAVGTCTLTISNTSGTVAQVGVTVTTLNLPIQ
jgi:hypothetical protein